MVLATPFNSAKCLCACTSSLKIAGVSENPAGGRGANMGAVMVFKTSQS
jgi:hypothetical protein